MNLKKLFKNKHSNPLETEEELDELSEADKSLIRQYPFLEDSDVMGLYKSFLVHAGRCPKCHDFLYPDISQNNDGFYTVVKNCMDRNCDYSKDVSDLFNEHLGIRQEQHKSELKAEEDKVLVYDCEDEKVKIEDSWSKPKIKKGATVPLAYYNVYASERSDDKLLEMLPNCPECMSLDWIVSSSFRVEHLRMEAQACCKNCHAVYDITDYYGLFAYGDCDDILKKDYGIESLKDCQMKLITSGRKNKTINETVYACPLHSGYLQNSVKSKLLWEK